MAAVTGTAPMPPNGPTVGRISGRHSTGTPNSRHSSWSQLQVARFISEVREAVVTSVAKVPVSRSRNQASVVPRRSRRRCAGSTRARSQASLVAEK